MLCILSENFTEYNIVYKRLTKDESKIDVVGLATPKEIFATITATPKEVNEMIDGGTFFFRDEKGNKTQVDEIGNDFIRTKPDGKIYNNPSIRDCKFSKKEWKF